MPVMRNLMNQDLRKFISALLLDTIQRTFKRMNEEDTHRPFHAALLSAEVLKNSRFERSFSTSFGQGAIEKISAEVLKYNGGKNIKNQFESIVSIPTYQLHCINNHIHQLRNPRESGAHPNWEQDIINLNNMLVSPNVAHAHSQIRVISDLYWFKDGRHNYASIKTVKPNIDQTAQAKADLLTLKINDPNCNTFFCLYYNPYGENRSSYAHAAPANIFNFKTDPCVLIGKDYWDHLGGEGFYEDLLDVFEEVGQKTRLMF